MDQQFDPAGARRILQPLSAADIKLLLFEALRACKINAADDGERAA